MSGEATRLTLYVLISAIEDDLRAIISDHVFLLKNPEDVFGVKLLSALRARRDADLLDQTDDTDLVLYLNIGDAIDIVQRESALMGNDEQKNFRKYQKTLSSLIPIRNRVMHGRPLLFDDNATTTAACRTLIRSQGALWKKVATTLEKLQTDTSYLLSVDFIPEEDLDGKILHNLPLADFDDTGFIGRSDELTKIDRALRGAFPVITITGEGGLGKTALALKACYDLIDSGNCPFEAVVWTTAKTTKLTTNEIKSIDGAISTSLGIFENAVNILDVDDRVDPLEKLLTQLEAFPILLIIDNLETVLDQNIKSLVERVPRNSKILFTSKGSIGAFDFPIPLKAFTAKESAFYLRSVAKHWAVDSIRKANQITIDDYCKKLQYNPLFLKWFVQAVAGGQSPERVISNRKIILEFCLSFIIDKLSSHSRKILDALTFLSSGQSEASIVYYTALGTETVQRGLNELISSNLVRFSALTKEGLDQEYVASDLAMLYIRSYVKEKTIDEKQIIIKKRALAFEREKNKQNLRLNYFDLNNVFVRSDSDLFSAKLLKESIAAIKADEMDEAQKIAESAKEMSPSYFETHRVLATIYSKNNQLMKAQQSFDDALSFKNDHAPLHLWYGDFLLKQMEDYEGALVQYDLGLFQNNKSAELIAAKARHHFIMREFSDGLKLVVEAQSINGLTVRMQRRLVDLHCQYFTRFIDFLIAQEDFDGAIGRVGEFKTYFENADLGLVDRTTIIKIRKMSSNIELLLAHNSVVHPVADITEVCEWFGKTFLSANVSLSKFEEWEVHGEEEVFSGEISKVLTGYGFIRTEKGQLFFAHSHWVGPNEINGDMVNCEVLFKLRRNTKGFHAIDLQPRVVEKVSEGRFTGEFRTAKPTFGFIRVQDGETVFFSYSEFKPHNQDVIQFMGRRVSCQILPAKKGGKYRIANDVRLIQ